MNKNIEEKFRLLNNSDEYREALIDILDYYTDLHIKYSYDLNFNIDNSAIERNQFNGGIIYAYNMIKNKLKG